MLFYIHIITAVLFFSSRSCKSKCSWQRVTCITGGKLALPPLQDFLVCNVALILACKLKNVLTSEFLQFEDQKSLYFGGNMLFSLYTLVCLVMKVTLFHGNKSCYLVQIENSFNIKKMLYINCWKMTKLRLIQWKKKSYIMFYLFTSTNFSWSAVFEEFSKKVWKFFI